MDLVDADDLFGADNPPDFESDQENEPPLYDDDDDDDDVQRYGGDEAIEVPVRKKKTKNEEEPGAQLDLNKTEEAKKRVVRNPQPKLDPDRICGKRGIGILQDTFKDFNPKGKGHEYSDLDRMMKKMEHWAHRLYPKLPFDDVMDRISVLGKKQAVKTYVKKIRQDMIVAPTSKEYIDDNEEGEDNTARYDNDDAIPNAEEQGNMEDDFSRIFGQGNDDIPSSPNSPPRPTSNSSLTQEQRDRIERNKRLATERRKQILSQSASQSQSQANEVSASEDVPNDDDLEDLMIPNEETDENMILEDS